ncbi:metallophosphoesterase [Acinetobacter sp. ANC 4648]|uniref:metallophosphoesterase n=1 Tax=Acinetobacter sp. ANC 4648 TaxID=1977875 RepID=UPI000A34A813|nr:metallophosphoesterase [Acinetobacter sp. ANC 4648]OTG80676.1 serine/threonine-protein phosphatase 2 [Acinetobacter sp. ANC 4648]
MVWLNKLLGLGRRDVVQAKTQIYQHETGRLFVVGDVHGCYDQLMQQLAAVKFNFNQDLLVAVGDLVDRGADSLKCLNLVDQPWFKAIRGNHEEMCILSKVDRHMADLHVQHGGEWFYALDPIQREQVIQKCVALPIILEIEYQTQCYGFVHADIHKNQWDIFKKSVQSNHELAVWGRGRIRNKRPELYSKIQGIDLVFLGHTVVDCVTKRENCYFLDTGCVFGKELTLVEISPNISIEQQVKVVE